MEGGTVPIGGHLTPSKTKNGKKVRQVKSNPSSITSAGEVKKSPGIPMGKGKQGCNITVGLLRRRRERNVKEKTRPSHANSRKETEGPSSDKTVQRLNRCKREKSHGSTFSPSGRGLELLKAGLFELSHRFARQKGKGKKKMIKQKRCFLFHEGRRCGSEGTAPGWTALVVRVRQNGGSSRGDVTLGRCIKRRRASTLIFRPTTGTKRREISPGKGSPVVDQYYDIQGSVGEKLVSLNWSPTVSNMGSVVHGDNRAGR